MKIWTIGHSNKTLEDFLSLLLENNIELVADIRRFPASRRYPYFNKSELEQSLSHHKILYEHFEKLGGRRSPSHDSKHTEWRHSAFRGYADYMDTDEFKNAVELLGKKAKQFRTAYMCSEVLWWQCHRALVSDYFKSHGWEVLHIMGKGKITEHPYTEPARQKVLF